MKSCKTGHFHNGLLGNFLVMEIDQFIHIAGKDITGFIFSQNNAIVIYKDFKRVMFADIQVASELNRERNSSEIIQLSYLCFSSKKPPYFRQAKGNRACGKQKKTTKTSVSIVSIDIHIYLRSNISFKKEDVNWNC